MGIVFFFYVYSAHQICFCRAGQVHYFRPAKHSNPSLLSSNFGTLCIFKERHASLRMSSIGMMNSQAKIFVCLALVCRHLESRWGKSSRVEWRNWSLIRSYWVQLSRVFLSARSTCNTLRGSAQKSQRLLSNCRSRCAEWAAVVLEYDMRTNSDMWPLVGSKTP